MTETNDLIDQVEEMIYLLYWGYIADTVDYVSPTVQVIKREEMDHDYGD